MDWGFAKYFMSNSFPLAHRVYRVIFWWQHWRPLLVFISSESRPETWVEHEQRHYWLPPYLICRFQIWGDPPPPFTDGFHKNDFDTLAISIVLYDIFTSGVCYMLDWNLLWPHSYDSLTAGTARLLNPILSKSPTIHLHNLTRNIMIHDLCDAVCHEI